MKKEVNSSKNEVASQLNYDKIRDFASIKSCMVFLQGSVFQPGVATPWGRLPFFYGSRELMIKYSITFLFYISYMEPVFVASKVIGSSGINDSPLYYFIQNCFKCDYDHYNTEYDCVWQRTNNFVT